MRQRVACAPYTSFPVSKSGMRLPEPLKIADAYSHMTHEVERRIRYESLNQSARLASESLSRQHIRAGKSTCIVGQRGWGLRILRESRQANMQESMTLPTGNVTVTCVALSTSIQESRPSYKSEGSLQDTAYARCRNAH